jgi:hypothetical protein
VRQSSSDGALDTEVESVDGKAAVSNRNFGLKVHREYEICGVDRESDKGLFGCNTAGDVGSRGGDRATKPTEKVRIGLHF